jgi:hypothetical protein
LEFAEHEHRDTPLAVRRIVLAFGGNSDIGARTNQNAFRQFFRKAAHRPLRAEV